MAQGTNPTHPAAEADSDDDLQLGDLVVIMAEPGPFRVAEIDPPYVVIESNQGVRRRVRDVAVRKVSADPPVAR